MTEKPEETLQHTGDTDRQPLYARPWFKGTALLVAVAVMLVLLGLLFSPRYWRF